MPRLAPKVDRNQSEIVAALKFLGASVQHLHAVGQGCPDLLVGYRGRDYLVEVKDGNKPPSARKLNDRQIRWHSEWNGARPVLLYSSDHAVEWIETVSRVWAVTPDSQWGL